MRAGFLGALLLGAVGVTAVVVTSGARESVAPSDDQGLVASVDGSPITKDSFDMYAGVFIDPGGVLRVSRDQILLSLINQELVAHEAVRLGIAVSESEIDAMIAEQDAVNLGRSSIARSGGIAGLRGRVRSFVEFDRVKTWITSDVSITEHQVRESHQSDPRLSTEPLDAEMQDMIRQRLRRAEIDRLWSEWLRDKRSCAAVLILDPSFGVTSSTPRPGCR